MTLANHLVRSKSAKAAYVVNSFAPWIDWSVKEYMGNETSDNNAICKTTSNNLFNAALILRSGN
jgi:hypothetical protein